MRKPKIGFPRFFFRRRWGGRWPCACWAPLRLFSASRRTCSRSQPVVLCSFSLMLEVTILFHVPACQGAGVLFVFCIRRGRLDRRKPLWYHQTTHQTREVSLYLPRKMLYRSFSGSIRSLTRLCSSSSARCVSCRRRWRRMFPSIRGRLTMRQKNFFEKFCVAKLQLSFYLI